MQSLTPAITLIRPPQLSSKYSVNAVPVPPIGLAYIAGYLKARNLSVKTIDCTGLKLNHFSQGHRPYLRVEGLNLEETLALIPRQTEIIGISAMFSQEWVYDRNFISKIKSHFPLAKVIVGGEHVSSLPEYTLRDCPAIDFAVLGEGEEVFFQLCKAILNGNSPLDVEGIAYLDQDKSYICSKRASRITNVETIPSPDWSDIPLESYFARSLGFGPSFGRSMPILATRGCPYQCTFCSSPNTWTTRYVARSPSELIEEIRRYVEEYRITGLQFYDLTMIIKKSWIHEFCTLMIKEFPNISWSPPIGTRSEALDAETLDLMAKAGCSYLAYAPESGSQEALIRVKKKLKLDNISKSIIHATQTKLPTKINLIIGFPEDTRRDIYLTLWYGIKAAFWGVDDCSFNMFYAYPGSEIFFQKLRDQEIRLDDDFFDSLTSHWELFAFTRRRSYSASISTRELIIYRFIGLASFYSCAYLTHPQKILRFAKNLFSGDKTNSTIEQRAKVFLMRRWEIIKKIFTY